MKIRAYALRLTALVVAVALVLPGLVGCSFLRDLLGDETLSFSRQSITMHVGESCNIAEYIESNKATYSLKSSDTSIVTVNSRTREVTAVSVGVAYVTAETNLSEARLKVTVEESEPDSLEIDTQGELIQTAGNYSEIVFTPVTSGAAAKGSVAWYVNDRFVNSLPQGSVFKYTPKEAGVYVVSAQTGKFKAEVTVRVYYSATATVECNTDLTLLETPCDDVVFTVVLSGTDDCYIQWFEDGKEIYAGDRLVFTYKPKPGRYTLSANVNGNEIYSETVFCKGAVAPQELAVVFDNMYPHVYLEYSVMGNAKVEITSPDNSVKEYSQTDARYAGMFDDGRMDMGSLITLCSAGSSRRTYRFRVKSLGDGDAFTESDYSDYCVFTQLPNAAKRFVETIIPCGDLYVTSDAEYVAVAEYYVFSRKKTANTRVSFDCYIAYDRVGSATDLWNDAFALAATSGMYSNIRAEDNGQVMSTSFTVSTVNAPTRQTSATSSAGAYSTQLHAVLPHINYDSGKYRPSGHVFPIDRREHTVSVSYSDELYYAAQGGYTRPEPVSGSAAETLYERARDVLRKICTDDMTDVQKAHAIYDWILWQVTYDNPAASASSGGESLSAYYLEGVFGDGDTAIGGVRYNPYAVCDGMSKAYALMCNIEGIPCVRVIGKAGKSLQSAGGHAWNKVKLGGQWYTVDCTWGDSQAQMSIDGGVRTYELGLHDNLFRTDAQMSSTHYEPYRTGESSLRYAPATAKESINVYKTMSFNGTEINCHIASGEDEQTRVREIASAYAATYQKRTSMTVPGGPNGGVYSIGWQGFEIYSENGITLSDNNILSTVSSAIKARRPSATVKVFTLDKTVLVLVK